VKGDRTGLPRLPEKGSWASRSQPAFGQRPRRARI